MANRILGMGDVLSLIEKVEQSVDAEKAKQMEKKFRKAQFTFDDFFEQLQQIQKMGSLSSILGMIPGMSKVKDLDVDETRITKVQAIIQSMTKKERKHPKVINYARKKRIAKGCGQPLSEVTKLVKNFEQMKKMMKKMNKSGMKGMKGLMRGGGLPF
jgi:signal recognition particle subunit SRP54